jgi:putative membrane protein
MFLLRSISTMLAMLVIAWLFPSLIRVENPMAAFVAALILGLVNGVLRPVLVLLTLPITFLTLGIFLLIINGLMLGLAAAIVPGVQVNGLFGAAVAAILISFVSWIFSALLEKQ